MPDPSIESRNYDAVASFYERLANLYSFGLIRKAKMSELRYLEPGMRVLYLGVGTGEEAVAAAARGVEVTAIDLSARMIERLKRRLDRRGLTARLVTGDVMDYRPAPPFDAVCGNYFFNVFSKSAMPQVLAHAGSFLKPDGVMMIADMAPQRGAFAPLGWLYLKAGLSFFWLLGLASQHPIYDYAEIGAGQGLKREAIHDFGPRRMPLYRTVVLRRQGVRQDEGAWT